MRHIYTDQSIILAPILLEELSGKPTLFKLQVGTCIRMYVLLITVLVSMDTETYIPLC